MRYSLTSSGSWEETFRFLNNAQKINDKVDAVLVRLGAEGCAALAATSPQLTGLMANSWGCEIERNSESITMTWHNYDIEGGYNVAILIQYGHGTGTGGYVQGYDFINPAMQPLFENVIDTIWREVISA